MGTRHEDEEVRSAAESVIIPIERDKEREGRELMNRRGNGN